MNAKKSLCLLAEALAELDGKVSRQLLVDYVLGNKSQAIKAENLQEGELFGSGDEYDEEHYNSVIDEALSQKLMVEKGGNLLLSAKGKKAVKDITEEFLIADESEDEQPEPVGKLSQDDTPELDLDPTPHESVGSRSRLKIHLIQAVDRKVALDDFAEQQKLDFHEVLDMVEALKRSGRKLDISYFLNDVLEAEDIDELNACFAQNGGNLDDAYDELGDVYSPEEIRLAYLQWEK